MTPARLAAIAVIPALAACATPAGPSGRWIGQVTPKTTGPLCIASRGVLQMRDQLVSFEPNEGTWVLQGEAKPDGTLYADRTTIGADKKPFETTLEGRWTPTTVTATYTTPRCTFTVALSRPS